eukprot:13739558-Alexandrium_andersonii.AAC.1
MSASLVGSEMCIRDRGKTEATRASLAFLARRCPWSAAPSPPSLSVSAPVSYTHLTLPTICSV